MNRFAIGPFVKRPALAPAGNKSTSARLRGCWSWLLIVAVHLAAAIQSTMNPAIAQGGSAQSAGIASSEATATLKRLHDHLRNAVELNFDVSVTVNSSVGGGTTQATAAFLTRKPNIFRVEAAVKGGKYVILSDGKLVTISRPANRIYAQYPASDSLLGTMYTIAGLTNITGRMLDFFWAVNAGRDVTLSEIPWLQVGGRQCAGIRVVRFEETFDVWLEPKGDPLPCRLQSRRIDGAATTVHTYIFKWKSPATTAADAFSFTSPKGSRQVDALELR